MTPVEWTLVALAVVVVAGVVLYVVDVDQLLEVGLELLG